MSSILYQLDNVSVQSPHFECAVHNYLSRTRRPGRSICMVFAVEFLLNGDTEGCKPWPDSLIWFDVGMFIRQLSKLKGLAAFAIMWMQTFKMKTQWQIYVGYFRGTALKLHMIHSLCQLQINSPCAQYVACCIPAMAYRGRSCTQSVLWCRCAFCNWELQSCGLQFVWSYEEIYWRHIHKLQWR